MAITIKDDDLLSYLTVTVGSHGFSVALNTNARFRAEINSFGIELKNTSSKHGPNISVGESDVDKLVYDERSKPGREAFIMVFPYGRSEDQILEVLHPQLKALMEKYRNSCIEALANANEMLTALDAGPMKQYLCPIK